MSGVGHSAAVVPPDSAERGWLVYCTDCDLFEEYGDEGDAEQTAEEHVGATA